METIVFSEKFLKIVPAGVSLERLETGFEFLEGPVWDKANRQLYFTDFRMFRIFLRSGDGVLRLFTGDSGRAIGLAMDAQGRLLSCESKRRRIARLEHDGSTAVLADRYGGKRINSPNDIIVKSDGSVYFTDPYSTAMGDAKELFFNGVYRIDAETGDLTLLADDFVWPNGLAFSPDEKILYINDTGGQFIKAFDVKPDGAITNGRVFAELDTAYGAGAPDGMKVDAAGNVYVTGPGGIWVISQEGEKLGILKMPEYTANMCFGEDNGRTLFITASTSLYSVRLLIPGI